jgi:hypothetical protein
MNIKKSTSWLTIFGISLIPTIFFFIQEIPTKEISGDAVVYFGLTPYFQSLLIATCTLLLITLFVAFVFLRRITTGIKFVRLLLVTIIAWISSLAIKCLLIISGWPWDTAIMYSFFKDPSFVFKIIWFLLPFIAVILVLVINKNSLDNLIKFLGALGLAFLLIATYRIAQSIKAFHIPSWENKIQYDLPNNNARKVIWVVFDEFDPEIAFSESNLRDMPNFKILLDSAVSHSKMYAPSNATVMSIPSMLMGVPTYGNAYHDIGMLEVKTSKQTTMPFSYKNTIFHRLSTHEFNSSILGFYHPYCAVFDQIKCKSFPVQNDFKWYSGIVHAYAHQRFLKIIDKFFNENYLPVSQYDYMANITEQQLSLIPKYILDKNVNFSFIHLNVPHLPSYFAQELFTENSDNHLGNYRLNLRLADYFLNEILENTNQIKNQKVLLILSSDHWFRGRDEGKFISHPALFIAKINDDTQKISLTKSTSSIYIEEMVNKFLNNEISSHGDIQNYLSDKSFHETFFKGGLIQSD